MLLLLFRSDTRVPEEIFQKGFSTRIPPLETITPISPFESDRERCIALSAKFEAVPFFPNESKETQTWVYVLAVDNSQDQKHFLDLHSRSLSTDAEKDLPHRLPFQEFVKEVNVIHVSPENILCAFQVKRNLVETYCSKDKTTTPDCESFVIEQEALHNPKAEALLRSNPNLNAALHHIVTKYNSKVGQEIDVPEPKLKQGEKEFKRIFARSAFFVKNRLEPLKEYSRHDYPFATNQTAATQAFFKTASIQNSSGLLFSSEDQICKQNSLFFKAIEAGVYDKAIEAEEKSKDVKEASIVQNKPELMLLSDSEDGETASDSEEELQTLPPTRKFRALG